MTSPILIWTRRIGYALLIASLIPVGAVIAQLIRARRAPYFAMRESALKRSKRWVLVALVVLVVGVDLLIVPPRLAPAVRRSGPTLPDSLTLTPTLTPGVRVSPTSHPTLTPTTTPTRRPTATPPFIPTPTPEVPPPEPALTPLVSAVPAGEDAQITIITLAAGRDDAGQPVDPGAEFPSGNHRIHLFICYEGMTDGIAWTFAIYQDGEYLDSTTQLWQGEVEGKTDLDYEPAAGYQPGIYEMRVFIEERLQGVAQFVIKG